MSFVSPRTQCFTRLRLGKPWGSRGNKTQFPLGSVIKSLLYKGIITCKIITKLFQLTDSLLGLSSLNNFWSSLLSASSSSWVSWKKENRTRNVFDHKMLEGLTKASCDELFFSHYFDPRKCVWLAQERQFSEIMGRWKIRRDVYVYIYISWWGFLH